MDQAELEQKIKLVTRKPRQRTWLLTYLTDPARDGTAAARSAGYEGTPQSLNTRSTRLRRLFRDIIDSYELAITDAAVMGSREVSTGLAELARDKSITPRDRLRAYELIARIHGMLTDTVKVEGQVQIRQQLLASLATLSPRVETLPQQPQELSPGPIVEAIEAEVAEAPEPSPSDS